MKRLIYILFLITEITFAQVKAFPTANGGGSNATGGRGQSVYHVTNLNNSGTGSFRDAVSQSNRTIVFDVSGTIELTSSLGFSSNLTIAGQTAPAGGITICGDRIDENGADNIIVRYVRFRYDLPDGTWSNDAVRFRNSNNIIFDHCSFSWGGDETVTFWAPTLGETATNITIQNCMVGEGKTAHILGDSDFEENNDNISYLRNMVYNITHRMPNVNVNGRVDIMNNVIFNWKYLLSRISGEIQLNYMNNYLSMGSLTSLQNDSGCANQVGDYNGAPSIYQSGNVVNDEGTTIIDKTDDGWTEGLFQDWNGGAKGGATANISYKAGSQFTDMINPPTLIGTDTLVSYLSNDVGAYKTLNADGTVTESWDVVDTAYKNGIVAGNGISYTSNSSSHNYHTTSHWSSFWSSVSTTPINTRPAGYDTDNDGMADLWESTTFGDLTRDGTGDLDGDGYTDLEEFLNLVDDAPAPIPVTGVAVDINASDLANGSTLQLTAVFTPTNATDKTGIWSSDNESVATVNQSGLVTGQADSGTATITFTANDGSFFDTCVITAISANTIYNISTQQRNKGKRRIIKLVKTGL